MLEVFQQYGEWGLFLGSFLASTVVPFSSDALFWGMLLVGGNPWRCFFVALAGNWLGGMTSFAIGWMGKWKWIEKWFHVKRETLERQKGKIDKWGVWLALFTWLPVVGDVFAIALGFYKLDVVKCGAFMLIGRAARFALWLALYTFFGIEAVI